MTKEEHKGIMNTQQSDTLRTDAQTYDISHGYDCLIKEPWPDGSGDHVSASFAFELERELNRANEHIQRLERELKRTK